MFGTKHNKLYAKCNSLVILFFLLDCSSRRMTNISEKQFEWLPNIEKNTHNIKLFENDLELVIRKIFYIYDQCLTTRSIT